MIYSAYPISARPYSSSGTDVRAYFDATFDLTASLTLKIYAATCAGYASFPTDALVSQPFSPTLKGFTFEQSIMSESEIGRFATGAGELIIANDDGQYDYLPQSYSIAGRSIVLKVGDRDGAYDDFFPLARLTARDWDFDNEIRIALEDLSYKLEVPLQSHVYGGAGGADGGADLAGKRKPLAFGECKNVSAVFVNPALLIYQIHDGAMQSIDAVYDKASALTGAGDVANYAALAAASVSSGQYKTCLAEGMFKLGSSANGLVTADVKGASSGGYVETTADIVRWALRNRTVLADPADLDAGSFVDLNTAQPAKVCYFHKPDDNLTVSNFIELLMGGIGGWGGHRLDGLFEVKMFRAPVGSPAASFTRDDMLGAEIKRAPLPDAYRPPSWRWRVAYARNWTVQTSDLAGGVTDARKALLAEPYRLAEATSATILTDYPFAQDRAPIESFFVNQADAAAEAARRIALFKTTRALYSCALPRAALRQNLGDEIRITHPRYDLSQGRAAVIIKRRLNVSFAPDAVDMVEVTLYG